MGTTLRKQYQRLRKSRRIINESRRGRYSPPKPIPRTYKSDYQTRKRDKSLSRFAHYERYVARMKTSTINTKNKFNVRVTLIIAELNSLKNDTQKVGGTDVSAYVDVAISHITALHDAVINNNDFAG